MNQSSYIDQITRLKDQFGEKAYGSERIQAIWDAVKSYDEKIFSQVITELISNQATPPLKAKIIDCYVELKRKSSGIDLMECVYCDGSGFICDEAPLPSVMRCRCANGEQKPKYIKQFQGMLIKKSPTKIEIENIRQAGINRMKKIINDTMNFNEK